MRWASLLLLAGCGRIGFEARGTNDGGADGASPDAAPCMPSPVATALQSRTSLSVAPAPYSLALADMNNDGELDLITASNTDATVGLTVGDGNGGFGLRNTFATGANPFGIAVADIDGDGNRDVVTANPGANTISVLYGNGDLTLATKTDYAARPGPRIPAIAQMSPGAPLDIAVNGGLDASFGVYRVNANRTVDAVQPYGGGSHPYAVALGDVDHNGFVDVVTADITDFAVEVSYASALDAFATNPVAYNTTAAAQAVVLADLDGDSWLDIIAADAGGDVTVYRNDGTGAFVLGDVRVAGANPVGIIAVDLTGDGILDVATANQGDNTVGLLLGKGDGTLQTAVPFPVGQQPYAIAAADLDGDGRNDVLVADNADGTISQLMGSCVR